LRERREDIPALVEYFLQVYSRKHARPVQRLSANCLQLLEERDWPGNIRELENFINRYVIIGSEDSVTEELLGGAEQWDSGLEDGSIVSLHQIARRASRAAERRVILRVLKANQDNRKKTARLLNISYRSLLYKIKDTGIPRKGYQENSPVGTTAEYIMKPRGMSYEPPTQ
jgi:transcriptional regulator with PAS, ATPase and Fis domain